VARGRGGAGFRGSTLAAVLVAGLATPSAGAQVPTPPPASPPAERGPDAGAPPDAPFGQEAVWTVVRSHEPDLKACYESRLAEGKDVRGEVVVSFVIALDGLPEKPRVKKSTLGDKTVEECVLRAVRRWSFPRPPRPQPVELPLRFDEIGRKGK
jgi:TonB family protein